MNRRAPRSRRGEKESKSQSHSPERSPLQFSDDEEEEEEEEESALSTNRRHRPTAGGRPRPLARSKSHDETYRHDDEDDEEDDSEEEERRVRRSITMPSAYGAASYLPTAYGAAGGPPGADGVGHGRERSVDRIRARTNDRRRDFSKERAGRRDRSTSRSRAANPEQQKANERAAQRRRDRRASLEASLGMLGPGMDDSASSFGGNASISSMASDAPSALLINGMDSSISSNIAPPDRPGRKPRRTQSRDSTSTDYTAERRHQQRAPPKATKTWDGRLDNVLNKRRQRQND